MQTDDWEICFKLLKNFRFELFILVFGINISSTLNKRTIALLTPSPNNILVSINVSLGNMTFIVLNFISRINKNSIKFCHTFSRLCHICHILFLINFLFISTNFVKIWHGVWVKNLFFFPHCFCFVLLLFLLCFVFAFVFVFFFFFLDKHQEAF